MPLQISEIFMWLVMVSLLVFSWSGTYSCVFLMSTDNTDTKIILTQRWLSWNAENWEGWCMGIGRGEDSVLIWAVAVLVTHPGWQWVPFFVWICGWRSWAL